MVSRRVEEAIILRATKWNFDIEKLARQKYAIPRKRPAIFLMRLTEPRTITRITRDKTGKTREVISADGPARAKSRTF